MKRTGSCLMFACVAVLSTCAASGQTPPAPRDVPADDQKLINTLLDMVEAHNRHDLERELSFYADDARFEMVGAWVKRGKEQLRRLFAQDVLLNSRLTLTDFQVQDNTVTFHSKEQNDVIIRLGIGAIDGNCQATFREDRIREVKANTSPASVEALDRQSRAFLEWVGRNRPQELEFAKRMVLGEDARPADFPKFVELLDQWQQAQKDGGVIPNDPLFPRQWHLQNTGQSGGTPGADINAPKAWEITTGDPNIVVAVIGLGVDLRHPDLVNNIVPGYDFWGDDDTPQSPIDPADALMMYAHETLCAGLIAAEGNNGIGVTGATWNCGIMPIREFAVLSGTQMASRSEARVADGFRWAAEHGAAILSNSWSIDMPSPILHSAVTQITKPGGIGRGGKGCVVFFCAPPYGTYPDSGPVTGPAAWPEVITVGAVDDRDVRLEYTAHGPELDLMAPGAPYPSWTPWYIPGRLGANIWTTGPSGVEDYFGGFGGTSAATPIAAGAAALMLSVEPNLTSEEVRHYLCRSARDLGEPGRDDYYGWGRVDARATLDMILAKRADLNNDWVVDEKDLDILLAARETQDLWADIAPAAKRDGVVDEKDQELLLKYLGTEIPELGLLARWTLDETEGTTAFCREGIPAVLYGGPVWQRDGGKVGGALLLDGVDDYISTGKVLDPSAGPFSVFVWIKGGAPGQVILSQQGAANWLLLDPAGALTTNQSSRGGLLASAAITDGQWHRVGLTWDGTVRVLYIDDVEVARDTRSLAALLASAGGLYIGAGSTLTPGTLWSGLIDDVRIYNRAVKP